MHVNNLQGHKKVFKKYQIPACTLNKIHSTRSISSKGFFLVNISQRTIPKLNKKKSERKKKKTSLS